MTTCLLYTSLPKFYKTIDTEFGGNYAKYVDYLWEKSLIMKKGAKLYFNKKGYEKDPVSYTHLFIYEVVFLSTSCVRI